MPKLCEVDTYSLAYKLWVEDIYLGFKKIKRISIPSVAWANPRLEAPVA